MNSASVRRGKRNTRTQCLPDNDEDDNKRMHRRQRFQAHRRRTILVSCVKFCIWLVGAYAVRDLVSRESFKLYIIVSILVYVFVSLRKSSDADGENPINDDDSESTLSIHGIEDELITTRVSSGPSLVRSGNSWLSPPRTEESSAVSERKQLFEKMKCIGTAPAMRCITDRDFRDMVRKGVEDMREPCVCGSGDAFSLCCRQLHHELVDLLGGFTA